MENRRTVLLTLSGALVGTSLIRASASEAVFPGRATEDTPTATVIKGAPPILDFGDGLRIPCDKSAFLTLWEGKTFWLTVGAGRSAYSQRAQGEAVLYALGAMKLLLMTLAFAPDRLDHADGGWRLKTQDPKNYVRGSIDLPGKPYWPITDADFSGFGEADSSALGGSPETGGIHGSAGSNFSVDTTGGFNEVNAITTYIVLKKNCNLDDVRARAKLL
jgi:hypothetical protein